MRIAMATLLIIVTFGSPSVLAGGPTRPVSGANPKALSKPDDRGRDRAGGVERADAGSVREAAALAFVRENHAELADLLEQLKAMKPDQYDRAIAELSQVSRSLANLRRNDDRRYRLALEAWKAKSRAELLAAQMVGAPDAALEVKLRAAIEKQIGIEVRQQEAERENLEARLKKVNESIARLETRRDALVESRYRALLKKGQRTRRSGGGPSAPARSSGAKGEE